MQKKKKILFFHFDLQGGGAEKVLINLISHLNKSKYDITLYTIFGVGANLTDIPKDVHFKCLFKRLFKGSNTIMKLLPPTLLYRMIIRKKYDVEIGYLETSPTRIISGSNNTKSKKYAWVHVEIDDIKKFLVGFKSKKEAISCYNRFDSIFCVSKTVKQSFVQHFPEISVPINVLYNVNDYDKIFNLSKESISINLDDKCFNICSVGRLTSQKRFDRLIRISAVLKEQGYNFHVFILGEGGERDMLVSLIKDNELNSYITLLGYDVNPYKYVSKMDLFICSSSKEGYSTAVSEAIALNIPVLTTDVSGMSEILNDGEYGMIVNNDESSLLKGLKNIMDDRTLLSRYKNAIRQKVSPSTNSLVKEYENLLDL